mmetsp:Transcript_25383/g.66411  ORF Transcript_25383/g.66411 Transcript_25383/m.66411 type:complete len:320 (-) Transcript_25383:507-1466(-)
MRCYFSAVNPLCETIHGRARWAGGGIGGIAMPDVLAADLFDLEVAEGDKSVAAVSSLDADPPGAVVAPNNDDRLALRHGNLLLLGRREGEKHGGPHLHGRLVWIFPDGFSRVRVEPVGLARGIICHLLPLVRGVGVPKLAGFGPSGLARDLVVVVLLSAPFVRHLLPRILVIVVVVVVVVKRIILVPPQSEVFQGLAQSRCDGRVTILLCRSLVISGMANLIKTIEDLVFFDCAGRGRSLDLTGGRRRRRRHSWTVRCRRDSGGRLLGGHRRGCSSGGGRCSNVYSGRSGRSGGCSLLGGGRRGRLHRRPPCRRRCHCV